MPIYAYRCESCGHAKDVLQKVSDPLLTTCPACGTDSFRKQLTAAGFQLKGSGWYVTDFRNNGGAGASPAAAAKSDTKTDTASGDAAAAPAPAAASGGGDSAPAAGCGTSCACH